MTSGDSILQSVQETLGPHLRPREEAAHIRRVLALHLDSCLGHGPATTPLALVEPTHVAVPPEARACQRDFLDALAANLKAQTDYDKARQKALSSPSELAAAGRPPERKHLLDQHLARLRLVQKRDRVEAVARYLDLLSHKSAASVEFVQPQVIFQHTKSLPNLPEELVHGLALHKTVTGPDRNGRLDQLEKHVLRAKLRLLREEQLLEDMQMRSTARPDTISAAAKRNALHATRHELVQWIEMELRKAAEDGSDAADASGASRPPRRPHRTHDGSQEKLAAVDDKYSRYLASRTSLLQLASQLQKQQQQPPLASIQHRNKTSAATSKTANTQAPSKSPQSSYLLTPYLANLVALAREQKSLIAHKSHFNIALARQLRDNARALDRLAAESHLLRDHGSAQPHDGASNHGLVSASEHDPINNADAVSRVEPWVSAAQSAKIATFEDVAEKIEQGQLALEQSGRALDEMELLIKGATGQETGSVRDELGCEAEESDLWLGYARSAASRAPVARTHTNRRQSLVESDHVWGILHGHLGLLGAEEDV